MKTIKILGTGCPNCAKLEANVKIALEKSGVKANLEKVTDIAEIMSYNIMSMPWIVIDEKVVSSGKVLEVEEIINLLKSSCCDDGQDCCNDSSCCDDIQDCCNDSSCCQTKAPETPKKSCCCSGNC